MEELYMPVKTQYLIITNSTFADILLLITAVMSLSCFSHL